MTVEVETARVSYTGAGTTGPFSIPFYFLQNADIKAVKVTIADGTETALALTTDYTLSGAGDEAGGSLTLVSSLSSSFKLVIYRDPALLQEVDYPRNDPFPAKTHEQVADRLTMIAQRLKDLFSRMLRLTDGDTTGLDLELPAAAAADRAGAVIGFDSNGTALQLYDPSSAVTAASNVNFTPSGTQPTTRTVENKLQELPTVGDYALRANYDTKVDTLASTPPIHPKLVEVQYPVEGAMVNLYKWLQGGMVVAGRPADAIFSSLQDAVDEADDIGRALDFLGTWTLSSSLIVKDRSDIRGHGRNSVIKIGDSMDDAAIRFTSTSANLLGVHLSGFEIDGNKSNQASTSARGIYFENSGGTSTTLARHILDRIYIHDTKGDGLYFGAFMRASILKRLWIYHCDEYGLHLPAAGDCHVGYIEVGQSGKDGVFLNGTGSMMLSHIKSWFSGRLTSGSNGFFLRNASNTQGNGLYAQENSGHGFSVWGQSGALKGINLVGCTSDSDNTAGSSFSGMSLNNVNGARIDLKVTKFTGATGTPTNGINMTADTINCEIDLACDSQSAAVVDGAGVGNNKIKVNGNPLLFVEMHDDFLGDVLADQWNGRVGSDAQCVAPAISAQTGGAIRMSTGDDAAADMATNGVQLESQLTWAATTRGLMIEVRLKISAITSVALFLGFTDQVSALEMPFTISGTTLTSNATDAVGVLFDTDATTDNWKLVGVANNVDATVQDAGVAPTVDTYETWRIVFSNTGAASFFRRTTGDFSQIGSTMTGSVTASVRLTPVIAAFSRSAASRNVDVDYIRLSALR